jgi:hypothetical protein
MSTVTSRRAVLAGAATLPALSLPAIAAEPDPIFRAIERHKVTFKNRMQANEIASDASHTPENNAIHKASEEADDADTAAVFALAGTLPTTMAGIQVLIDYVEAFNNGAFGGINGDWYSAPWNWPSAHEFDFEGDPDDADGELGMNYAVLLQVRAALKAIAVRS